MGGTLVPAPSVGRPPRCGVCEREEAGRTEAIDYIPTTPLVTREGPCNDSRGRVSHGQLFCQSFQLCLSGA